MRLAMWGHIARRLSFLTPAATPAAPVPICPATVFEEMAEPGDHQFIDQSLASLHQQMHTLINRNADGVNRSALKLRRVTDILLTLGVSDPYAAKAGSYAQKALELANTGRGVTLQAEPCCATPWERAELVARAMALMLRAEMLMAAAMKTNRANIEAALQKQEQLMCGMRAALVCN
jgi:hypothetical protein